MQTSLIDPLSGSEPSGGSGGGGVYDRMMTETIPVQPWNTHSASVCSGFSLKPMLKYYVDVLLIKTSCNVCSVRLCARMYCSPVPCGMWVSRAGEHSGGKEGHGFTYPSSVIEYGRLRVMLESVRSPCPAHLSLFLALTLSLSLCPAWNFRLILRWGEEAVINTPQYLPCPLVQRESFTASLLLSYVNQNVHQKPFATLSTACKYMCTCKQPWQA